MNKNPQEYHERMMAVDIYMDYRKRRVEKPDPEEKLPEYIKHNPESLAHSVFFNPVYGHTHGEELLKNSSNEDYCRRWLHFHTPKAEQLSLAADLENLRKQKETFFQKLSRLTAPRAILFGTAVVLIFLLTFREHLVLTALLILLVTLYWNHTHPAIHKVRQILGRHSQQIEHVSELQQDLHTELGSLPPPADQEHFSRIRRHGIQHLLHTTLSRLLSGEELQNVADALHTKHWRTFAAESWGALQLPLRHDENITQQLLENPDMLLAAQPGANGGLPRFRTLYLRLWTLTDSGVLTGEGFYDQVGGRFLYKRQDFLPYAQIQSCTLTEQLLPELAVLKERLPDTIYQRYFRHPVSVLNIQTYQGVQYIAVCLPQHETRKSPALWAELDISMDLHQLNRYLHHDLHHRRQASS